MGNLHLLREFDSHQFAALVTAAREWNAARIAELPRDEAEIAIDEACAHTGRAIQNIAINVDGTPAVWFVQITFESDDFILIPV